MLITPDELLRRLGDPAIRIADVRWYLNDPDRARAEYAAGHLPGAVFVDVDLDLAAPPGPGRHPLPEPAIFTRRMSDLGIGSEHFVVAYDDTGGTTAARLWWMLDSLGHHDAAVLDGGIAGWVAAGGPLEAQVPVHSPAQLDLDDHWTGVITRAELIERLGHLVVLDGRAPERYRGEIEPIDPIAGHIPTAHSLPVTGNLDAEGRFRHPAELRERLHWVSHEAAGMNGGRDASGHATGVVAYCGSGVNACHNILAMRLAGLPAPLLYAGSFSDWSRAGLPVGVGPEPGERPRAL